MAESHIRSITPRHDGTYRSRCSCGYEVVQMSEDDALLAHRLHVQRDVWRWSDWTREPTLGERETYEALARRVDATLDDLHRSRAAMKDLDNEEVMRRAWSHDHEGTDDD